MPWQFVSWLAKHWTMLKPSAQDLSDDQHWMTWSDKWLKNPILDDTHWPRKADKLCIHPNPHQHCPWLTRKSWNPDMGKILEHTTSQRCSCAPHPSLSLLCILPKPFSHSFPLTWKTINETEVIQHRCHSALWTNTYEYFWAVVKQQELTCDRASVIFCKRSFIGKIGTTLLPRSAFTMMVRFMVQERWRFSHQLPFESRKFLTSPKFF